MYESRSSFHNPLLLPPLTDEARQRIDRAVQREIEAIERDKDMKITAIKAQFAPLLIERYFSSLFWLFIFLLATNVATLLYLIFKV